MCLQLNAATMPVVDVDVHSREQYHIDGYERIDGRLRYAVDPSAAANAAITDLHLAPTDADGRVRFSGDFCLIHSTSGDDGPTRVLVDVCNRGRKIAVKDFCHGAPSAVQRDSRPGDGFLFHHGFAVLSLGWQWDTFSSDSLLGLDVPLLADAAGNAVSGQASVEIWPNAPAHTWSLASREHKRYPADTTAPAVLLVCDYPGGPQQVVPRSSWSFAREADQTGSAGSIVFSGPVVPSKEHIYFENGFTPVSRKTLLSSSLCPEPALIHHHFSHSTKTQRNARCYHRASTTISCTPPRLRTSPERACWRSAMPPAGCVSPLPSTCCRLRRCEHRSYFPICHFFAPMKNDDLPRQARDKWKVRCHHPENGCLFAHSLSCTATATRRRVACCDTSCT